MGLYRYPLDLTDIDNANWTKQTLDLIAPGGEMVHDEETLMRSLDADGRTLKEFKQLPSYWLAVQSGRYPWLAEL